MKITLLAIGKTDDKDLQRLITVYSKRLSHYVSFTVEMVPDIKNSKNLSEEQQKQLEGQEILKRTTTSDQLILLDENGKNYSSEGFAQFLQKKMNSGLKQLIFVKLGPFFPS